MRSQRQMTSQSSLLGNRAFQGPRSYSATGNGSPSPCRAEVSQGSADLESGQHDHSGDADQVGVLRQQPPLCQAAADPVRRYKVHTLWQISHPAVIMLLQASQDQGVRYISVRPQTMRGPPSVAYFDLRRRIPNSHSKHPQHLQHDVRDSSSQQGCQGQGSPTSMAVSMPAALKCLAACRADVSLGAMTCVTAGLSLSSTVAPAFCALHMHQSIGSPEFKLQDRPQA